MIHTFSKDIKRFVKCNQPRPGFELGSPCPFPTMIKHYTTGTIRYSSVSYSGNHFERGSPPPQMIQSVYSKPSPAQEGPNG